jgi:hypothetical protein
MVEWGTEFLPLSVALRATPLPEGEETSRADPAMTDLPTSAPMPPAVAEGWFRRLVESGALRLAFTAHARERLAARSVAVDGVLRVLAEGRVPAKPAKVDGLGRSKYAVEGAPAEDDLRVLRIVVVAAPRRPDIQVVTVMWAEEAPAPAPRTRRGGSSR